MVEKENQLTIKNGHLIFESYTGENIFDEDTQIEEDMTNLENDLPIHELDENMRNETTDNTTSVTSDNSDTVSINTADSFTSDTDTDSKIKERGSTTDVKKTSDN